jgi:hypothetical protein
MSVKMALAQRTLSTRTIRPRQEIVKLETLPRGFIRRIKDCRRTGVSYRNCIGSALYIVGASYYDEDRAISTYQAHEDYLKHMIRLSEPSLGCIVAWLQPMNNKSPRPLDTVHMGVITSVDPLLVTHRLYVDGPFIENVPFSKADKSEEWAEHQRPVKVAFYFPAPR